MKYMLLNLFYIIPQTNLMQYTWSRNPDDSWILRYADIIMVLSVSPRSILLQTLDTEAGCPGLADIDPCFFPWQTVIMK